LLLSSPFYLGPAVTRNLKTDRDRAAADFARQPSDGIGVSAVEAVGDAQNSREPFDLLAPAEVERREPPVPGWVRRSLRVISGNEGADQLILAVEAGDVEIQDHIPAQLVVFPRNHSRPADIMQPTGNFEEVPLARAEPMEGSQAVEKGEGERCNLLVVRRIWVLGLGRFRNE
jgi:hypothetical protein